MANITVSTSSNFDDSANLGLGNGENITINSGAVLTINSDVRWGQNAAVPAVVTVTDGELKIDGSQTWWIPFDASTGNVPALGTCGTPDVTRGGSNVGEFLGVFTALGVAPSAAGGAMPASGFIKLRSKSATLADNDVLTFAGGATITINSTTGGQLGWLHFVGRENVAGSGGTATASGLGKISSVGGWFELGVSNGTSGQTFQHYVSDIVPAVQVETGSGTGVYEWYGIAQTADFTGTNLSTDNRSRFFTCSSAGVITFGGSTCGKLPPNGARIRVPNIHVSSTTSANYAANTINTSNATYRWTFIGSPGELDLSNLTLDGCIEVSSCASLKVQNSCGLDGAWCRNNYAGYGSAYNSYIMFNNVASGHHTSSVDRMLIGFLFSQNITFTDVSVFKTPGYSSSGYPVNLTGCSNVTITRFESFNLNAGSNVLAVPNCSDVVFDSCSFVGQGLYPLEISGSVNVKILNCKFDSKLVGTSAGSNLYNVRAVGCTNVLVDGLGYYLIGLPASYECLYFQSVRNLKIRNIGTRSTNFVYPSRFIAACSYVTDLKVSRVYAQQSAGYNNSPVSLASSSNIMISDSGQVGGASSQVFLNTMTPDSRAKRTISGGLKSYTSSISAGKTVTSFSTKGIHFAEQEVSSTEIWLTVLCGAKKGDSDHSANSYTDDSGSPFRDNANGLQLRSVGDQVTWTWTYKILGLSGFANTAPILSGTNTGNLELTYDLDKGTGFSGTFKTLSAANLSSETGISESGVVLRVRARCATANVANSISAITVVGSTTSQLLSDNPYPYNETKVTLTNGVSGSLAAIFRVSDGSLLYRTPMSQPRLYPGWYADTTCALRVRKPGYDSYETNFGLTEIDASFPLNQVDNTIANTDPGALGITVTNHGASPVTWQGKQWSITVTVSDSSTAAQIAQYLSWHTAQDSFSLGSGVHNMAWPAMVIPSGTSFETVRGTLFGSAGASLKGVRVVNGSGDAITGFARMQSDDGSYYSPPVSARFELTGLKANTEVRVYKTSDMSELAGIESTTGTFQYDYVWASDIPVTVVIVSLSYQDILFDTTLTAAGTSIPISQQFDRQYNNPA